MSLQWYYMNMDGNEYGPFSPVAMRAWYDQGFFAPVAEDLRVRMPHWTIHRRLSEIYRGDRASYFVVPPLECQDPPLPGFAHPPPLGFAHPSHPSFAHPPLGEGYNSIPPHPGFAHPPPGYAHHPPSMWNAPPPAAMPYPPHAPPWQPPGYPPPMPGSVYPLAAPGYPPPVPGLAYLPAAYGYGRRDRSRSRSRSRSPPRRSAIEDKAPKMTPKEEADGVIKSLGENEVCRVLSNVVESLYQDRIRPLSLYVRGRLKEQGCQEGMLRGYLELFPRFPSVFSVLKESSACHQVDTVIELIDIPSWFKGWINVDDPEDKYEALMWQQLADYLKIGHEFSGGRYGMAKELQTRSLSFLSQFCLGELCNIVQLSIQKRKLVVYHRKLLKSVDKAVADDKANADGPMAKSRRGNGEFRCVKDLQELCVIMCRMYIRRGNAPIRLEQLRNMMQQEYSLTVSEMLFQCTKLSEVMKLEPLKSAFTLSNHNGSIRLTLGDPSQFSEDIRALHAAAVAAEQG